MVQGMTNALTLLASANRAAIGGGPRAGKSTLASLAGRLPGTSIISTDAYARLDWSAASEAVAAYFDEADGPLLVEGVTVVRALRKWLTQNKDNSYRPIDLLVWIRGSTVPLTPQQDSMRKGAETILAEIAPELLRRGVSIVVTGADGRETVVRADDMTPETPVSSAEIREAWFV